MPTRDTAGAEAICTLFGDSFAASDGPEEGRLVEDLARALIADPPASRRVFVAEDADGQAIAAIVFSRMQFGDDAREAWLLAPVAVTTGRQAHGLGTALIRHGLEAMRDAGAAVVVTYGDPAFYGRVGFAPASTDDIPPPQPLSQPHGWQALALDGRAPGPLPGPCRCAAAFDDPALW